MSDPAPEQSMDKRSRETADARAALDGAAAQFETPLLRYVGRLLGRGLTHEAEDVVQETFLRYYREMSGNGAAVRNASTWLFRVAHNLAMDTLRRQVRQNRTEAQLGETPPAPADTLDALIHGERCEVVLAELDRLPDDQRQMLLLRVVQGMKLREVSEVTGLTIGNAGYRFAQALQELTRRLKARGIV